MRGERNACRWNRRPFCRLLAFRSGPIDWRRKMAPKRQVVKTPSRHVAALGRGQGPLRLSCQPSRLSRLSSTGGCVSRGMRREMTIRGAKQALLFRFGAEYLPLSHHRVDGQNRRTGREESRRLNFSEFHSHALHLRDKAVSGPHKTYTGSKRQPCAGRRTPTHQHLRRGKAFIIAPVQVVPVSQEDNTRTRTLSTRCRCND